MNPTGTIYYTAAQIALALGRKRQALARALAASPADGCVVVVGQTAAAWSIAALPGPLQTELDALAQRRGFRNVQSLLAAPPQAWQPSLPLSEIAQSSLDKAAKLQRALARILERQNDLSLTAAALEQIGLEDYRQQFGQTLTARALRSLVKWTLDRDAGALNFSRLEIYLPETPARKMASKPSIALAVESEFRALHDAMASFKYPASPSPKEKSYLWLVAFEAYEEKLAEGKAPKKLKRSLLKFLERNTPFLVAGASASVANSLRVSFQRKYDKWVTSGRDAAALADNRPESSGRFRGPELSNEDKDKLTAHAVLSCGGRVAHPFRQCASIRIERTKKGRPQPRH